MNKKAFTLVEILAVIVILGVILSMAVVSYNKYLMSSQDKTFKLEEKNFRSAANNAYIQYLASKDKRLQNKFYDLDISGTTTIYLKELTDYNYIKKIKNPYNSNEVCNINSSYVKITNKTTNNTNKDLEYKVCLICGTHKSSNCP